MNIKKNDIKKKSYKKKEHFCTTNNIYFIYHFCEKFLFNEIYNDGIYSIPRSLENKGLFYFTLIWIITTIFFLNLTKR